MQAKTKKILNIVVDVVVAIVLIAVLILTINTLISQNKGYVPLFGSTRVAVLTDSMEGDKPDNFSRGDLLKVKLLKGDARTKLEVGQIVTFYMLNEDGERIINTHRIIRILTNADGSFHGYVTQGDNASGNDGELVKDNVIGVYNGHVKGLGNVTLWFQSSTGFFICVVLPSLLIVAYCVYLVVKAATATKRKKQEIDEKERLRREIMAELGLDPNSPEAVSAVESAETDVSAQADKQDD